MTALESNSSQSSEPRWYAVYTRSRHEHSVAMQLDARGVEFFLPECKVTRHWHDRTVRTNLPLFPSYVFVRIAFRECRRVLLVPGIVHVVGIKGQPTPLPIEEIETLRRGLSSLPAEPHPFLNEGTRVRIISGPLTGAQGIVLRRKQPYRLVLSIDLIQSSICVELEGDAVEPIQPQSTMQTPKHSSNQSLF